MGWLADESGLERCAANHVALTPLSFLARAADVFAGDTALVYGPVRRSYAELHARASRLASALGRAGVRPGDVVATLLPNVPAQVEAHWGVPASGAVLNTINTRLDTGTVAYILGHAGASLLFVDQEFAELVEAVSSALVERERRRRGSLGSGAAFGSGAAWSSGALGSRISPTVKIASTAATISTPSANRWELSSSMENASCLALSSSPSLNVKRSRTSSK